MTATDGELDALIEQHGLAILIDRCCAVDGADRALDKAIAETLGIEWPSGTSEMACHFTSLFEAAMRLKPEHFRVQLDEFTGTGWSVVLWPTANNPYPHLGGITNGSSSPTAPLAITIACLRVRLAIATRAKP